MAEIILTDAHFEWNSVDLSDHVRSVTINYESEIQDITAMGDDTRVGKGGLKNWSMDVEFNNDEAASSVAQTLFADVGVSRTVLVRPTSASVGTTNPNYTGTGVLESFPPLGGAVGEVSRAAATIQSAGDLSRATS